ncbi:hypothetical protein ACHAQA_006451 [Verticillium albo-atrum]
MPKQIITVFGATGAQGGSVVDIFLNDPKLKAWSVRGVTRNASSEKAKLLASSGVEVVAADLNDKAAVARAVQGSTAVYGVTNYWDRLDKNLEIQQGKNLADAVKEANVPHYIWSSLLNITKLSGGVLPDVYHFDGKADIEEYVRSLNIPASFFLAGFYASNLTTNLMKQTPPNNAWSFFLPAPSSSPIPFFDVADTGKFVKGIVLNWEKALGKRILGATNYITADEAIETFKKIFPKAGATTNFVEVPHEVYKGILTGQGFPDFAAEELLQNMRLLSEFGYFGGASLDESHEFVEDELTTWEQFAKNAKEFKGLE